MFFDDALVVNDSESFLCSSHMNMQKKHSWGRVVSCRTAVSIDKPSDADNWREFEPCKPTLDSIILENSNYTSQRATNVANGESRVLVRCRTLKKSFSDLSKVVDKASSSTAYTTKEGLKPTQSGQDLKSQYVHAQVLFLTLVIFGGNMISAFEWTVLYVSRQLGFVQVGNKEAISEPSERRTTRHIPAQVYYRYSDYLVTLL
jgi:hypothetical protein